MVVSKGDVIELWGDFGQRYHEFIEFIHPEFFDVSDGAMGEKDVIVAVFIGFDLGELMVECIFGRALGYSMDGEGLVVYSVVMFFVGVIVDKCKVGKMIKYLEDVAGFFETWGFVVA